MTLKKIFTPPFVVIAIIAFAIGCHPQNPVSTVQPTTANWGAASSCTSQNPTCSYNLFGLTVASASTACPAATGNYTQINTSPITGTTYTWSTEPQGVYRCYTVQAVQAFSGCPTGGCSGPASAPSNNGVAYLTPSVPTAPNSLTTTATAALDEKRPNPAQPAVTTTLAKNTPTGLMVKAGD